MMGVVGGVTGTSTGNATHLKCTGGNVSDGRPLLGDAPALAFSSTFSDHELPLYSTELVKGVAQPVVGTATYSTVISTSISDAEPMLFCVHERVKPHRVRRHRLPPGAPPNMINAGVALIWQLN